MNHNKEWISKETGRLLKELRKKAGYSQGDVARLMGYKTNQFISNIERGVCTPSPQVIRHLLLVFRSKGDTTSVEKLLNLNMRYFEAELKGKKVV